MLSTNGAGNSACVKLMAGVFRPTSETVARDGRPAEFESPQDAQRAGISAMHQHPGLFPDLTVARWKRPG